LAQVTLMDPAGVAALVSIRMAAMSCGTRLVLRSPSRPVHRVLQASDGLPAFTIEAVPDAQMPE
jgi:anti-anti-sigma regulatory factor